MAGESYDQSHIEKKYFIDGHTYNCPYCNIRNVQYSIVYHSAFNWSRDRACYYYIVECSYCGYKSLHLSNHNLSISDSQFSCPPAVEKYDAKNRQVTLLPIVENNKEATELDEVFFHHQPTSFFTIDNRIPGIVRELISEAEGCLKMNYLTGASACMRKAIYELIVIERCNGKHYEDQIEDLKKKYPAIDEALIDVLVHIKDMTSDKIHEQSWDKWDSGNLKLIIETLKTVLYEIYVEPANKKDGLSAVARLLESVKKPKKKEEPTQPDTASPQ